MGKNARERKERKEAERNHGIFDRLKTAGKETIDKASELAANAQLKKWGISSDLSESNIAKASKRVTEIIKSRARALPDIQADIARGMMKDSRSLLNAGKTKEEVYDYFWNIPAFKEAWAALEWDEEYLKAVIDQC